MKITESLGQGPKKSFSRWQRANSRPVQRKTQKSAIRLVHRHEILDAGKGQSRWPNARSATPKPAGAPIVGAT